jgi:hypothetical protein
MKRSNLLPDEIADWISGLSRADLRERLGCAITVRVTNAGLVVDPKNLAAEVEAHDARYFDAQEGGRGDEAMQEFKYARLLAARQFLLDGKEDDAAYEFFHSLDDARPETMLDALKKG